MIRTRGRERVPAPQISRNGKKQAVDNPVDKCFQTEDENKPVDNKRNLAEIPS